jgi:hypothetical protein
MSEDPISLGAQAQAVMDNPAFQKAIAELETATIEMWAQGIFKTSQEREDAYSLVRGARSFKMRLIRLLEDAKLTKAQAEQRERNRASNGTPIR